MVSIIAGVSVSVMVFYLFFVNLSTDTIILFIAQKTFLGTWIARGVVPLYNPHIFAGIPFLFDPGMGHLHPLNLFFVLPYPFSFSLWVGATTLLYLGGFYLFFRKSSSSPEMSLIFSLILFFSGSGFLRISNPTIFAVIAHYGLFLYSLSSLKGNKKDMLFPFVAGVLMTLSGHLQFVVYGYILGFITALFHFRHSISRTLLFFCALAVSVSWYFLLGLPLVLESTRIGAGPGYADIGPIAPLQLAQLVLPFLLGAVRNGSSWNSGPTAVLLFSLSGSFLFLLATIKGRVSRSFIFILALLFILSLGFIQIPFFRGAGQVWVLIHIIMLISLSRVKNVDALPYGAKARVLYLSIGLTSLFLSFFFVSPLFPSLFLKGYTLLKHGASSLFFDRDTVIAIGRLVAWSFIIPGMWGLALFSGWKSKKLRVMLFFLFMTAEGLMVNYFHGYFIPASVLQQHVALPEQIDTRLYRVQTFTDVVPYTGFHTYMGSLLFRPPFSKEKPIVDREEERTFAKLRKIFAQSPSSWTMVEGISGIQGYNTFVPKNIAEYFTPVSSEYKKEYAYIIERNSEFTDTSKISHINALDTSRITLNDTRWEKLAVKYFLADRQIAGYDLLGTLGNVFYFENKSAPAVYSLVDDSVSRPLSPTYIDPNRIEFNLSQNDVGKSARIIINPEGFKASINGKAVDIKTEQFAVIVPITSPGKLAVQYDPLLHLRQSLKLP